jgi:phage-related protein
MESSQRPIVWIGSSRRNLRRFPREIRRSIGYALFAAQEAKAIHRQSRPVVEIIADYAGDTWRAVYTVRYPEAIYVLHAFQKKSKRGIATPKKEIDLIRHRLAEAERLHRERHN